LRRIGRDAPPRHSTRLRTREEDFQRVLIVDGTILGYAYFQDDGRIEYLLHPHDSKTTGISYSLLPMIHAIINDLLTPAQAAAHVGYIKTHLPLSMAPACSIVRFPIQGGPSATSSAPRAARFSAEIGIMYTHAHLR